MWKYGSFVALMLVCVSQAAHLNRPQKPHPVSSDCPKDCKSKPLDMAFVVDASASIWPDNFTIGLDFIEDFVNIFSISPDTVRVSLVTYGERVYNEDAFGFTAHTNNHDLLEAISNTPYRSGIKTNTSGGIWYMLRTQMPEARPGVRRVAIVLTDGNSQEADLTKQAAADARDTGLEVFAIGVGHQVSSKELHNIASDHRHVFVVNSYDMLEGIKNRLAHEACDQLPSPECGMDPVDLSFVIDSSVSIGDGNFTLGMKFVNDFVEAFEINPSSVRVSAVTFGEDVNRQDSFDFDTFTNKKDVLDNLHRIKWRKGRATNTGAGIEYMRDVQMMPKARPNAAHICIVITDGQSQETKKTASQAKQAQDAGIVMYAVGVGKVGDQLDEVELNNIAGDPDRVVVAENYGKLNLIKEDLTHRTCAGIRGSLFDKAEKYRQ